MDSRRVLVVLLAVVGATAGIRSQGAAKNRHPGEVIKSTDSKPLDGAYAQAYAAQPAPVSSCPKPGPLLDQRKAENGGKYEFQIDSNAPGYYAVYCANGFQTSEVPTNDNSGMADVRPNPVRLIPNFPPKSDQTSPTFDSIAGVLDAATATLRRVQAAAATTFNGAVDRLTPDDSAAVRILMTRKEMVPGLVIRLPADPQRAIVIILNDATMHFTYFNRAAPDGFPAAARKFSTDEQRAIERLRTRPLSPSR